MGSDVLVDFLVDFCVGNLLIVGNVQDFPVAFHFHGLDFCQGCSF